MTDKNFGYSNHISHYQLDGEYYDFIAPGKFMEQEIRRRYQQVFRLFPPARTHRILEIGSGGGFAIDQLRKIKPIFFPADIPTGNLKKMRVNSPFTIYPCSVDAYHLPFSTESFDLVLLLEVIEHLESPQKVLTEAHRILKPSGKIVISVPYKEIISYQICIHCNQPTPTHSHLHSFDKDSLADLLKSAGIQPVKFVKNCNKVINRLHFNLLSRSWPFRLWRIFDAAANTLIDKPISLIVLGEKQNTPK
jgi:2-polyprenyl-3-methyl-5-hydroxy-6-metoxy-1,4-benzoquinol methylase